MLCRTKNRGEKGALRCFRSFNLRFQLIFYYILQIGITTARKRKERIEFG